MIQNNNTLNRVKEYSPSVPEKKSPTTLLERLNRASHRLMIVIVFILLATLASPALAQSYYFAVPELRMQVYMLPDSDIRLVYDITFQNSSSGQEIDIVDIGLPQEGYDISKMSASINGQDVLGIYRSEYVKPGVEIYLGSGSIPSSRSGVLHFEAILSGLVYGDVTNQDNASFQITPTWFGSEYVDGTTNLQIAIHMLPGIEPDEVLYQNQQRPFTAKAIFEDHVVVAWQVPDHQLVRAYQVGVSFPVRGMENVERMTPVGLAVMWFENSPGAQVIVGVILAVLFSFAFFRFTGGTGGALWLILVGIMACLFVNAPVLMLIGLLPMIGLVVVNEVFLSKKKKKYLPAIAQAEGGGIKRGLTAPEAAALLETPINKVLTLIIFGLLKKGILVQLEEKPLKVEVAEPFRAVEQFKDSAEREKFRRKIAQEQGTVIHRYEQPFLDKIEQTPGKALEKTDFSDAMKKFLETVALRVKGFDLSDTQEYYRKIVSRAWKEAQSIGELPEREKFLDRNMEWVLMHENYPTVFAPTPYRPIWMRPMIGTSTFGGGGMAKPVIGGGKGSGGSPSFGDVAGGFAGWAENTMGGLAGSILPGKVAAPGTRGAVNLSGLDKATGDFFEALSKSSSSGGGKSGGGGSSCACACAGCACACACAGGGR